MKVIIVSPSLDPTKNVSGISSVAQFIIKNNPTVEYVHFEMGRKDGQRGWIRRIFKIAYSLIEWKKFLKENPDVLIHYNFPLSGPSILRDPLFMQIAARMHHKMVVHIHGGLYLTAPKIPMLFERILNKVFSMDVPFITLSSMEADLIKKRYNPEVVYALPNCVDLGDAAKFKREFDDTKPLTLGYIGRIAETKGMDYLLQAAIKLKERGVDFRLHLAGAEENEGQYLGKFCSALGENFQYYGVVSGQKKDEFLRSLDVFTLPSFFEGLPMSLLECMSYGSVPVTTNVGSISSVVTDGDNGIFVELDADKIVSAVETLSTDRGLLKSMSEKAKDTVSGKFKPATYIYKLNGIYNMAK